MSRVLWFDTNSYIHDGFLWICTAGIVVPGLSDAPGAEHDPSNLCLLEATSGSGIACRPLLTVSCCDYDSMLHL